LSNYSKIHRNPFSKLDALYVNAKNCAYMAQLGLQYLMTSAHKVAFAHKVVFEI